MIFFFLEFSKEMIKKIIINTSQFKMEKRNQRVEGKWAGENKKPAVEPI